MKRKKICLNFKKKKKEIEVFDLNFFERFLGLMIFRKNLLFDFKKEVEEPIHSFFCPTFYAIWLDDKNKILEIQFVKPWRFSIKPKKKFCKLIEIPFSKENEKIIQFIVGIAKGLNSKLV